MAQKAHTGVDPCGARAMLGAELARSRLHTATGHTPYTGQQPRCDSLGAENLWPSCPHRQSRPASRPTALALHCTASLQAIGPARPPPRVARARTRTVRTSRRAIGPARPPPRVAPHEAPTLRPAFVALPPDGLIRAHSGRRSAMRQKTAPHHSAPARPAPAGARGGDLP